MAENIEDRTEKPTPKRREQARERGQVARSNDLTAAVLLLGFLILMNLFGGGLVKALRAMVASLLAPASLSQTSSADLGQIVLRAVGPVAVAAAPLFLGVMLIAVIVNIAQVGFIFSGKRLQPNFAAINPLRGLSKIFKSDGLMLLLTSILKIALITLVAYSAIHGRIAQIVTTQQLTFLQAFGLGADITYAVALRVGVLMLVLAILDYAWQRHRHERELRMTKQEVKEEMRSMDGDPKIKARRRQIAIQVAQQRMRQAVPDADVVVTNPTEFAVALKYEAGDMHAPKVVAKGQGYLAKRIREIAVASGVPIIERPPLARALYKLVQVGHEIPEQFYSAVAEILAYVYELTGKTRRTEPRLVTAN